MMVRRTTRWLALVSIFLPAFGHTAERPMLKAVLEVVPEDAVVWVGVQNVSGRAGAVCVEEGSLEVSSARAIATGADLLPRLSHSTPCTGSNDSWHLLQPSDRYYFLASYQRAETSAATMRVSLKVRFGTVGGFRKDSRATYITGVAQLLPNTETPPPK